MANVFDVLTDIVNGITKVAAPIAGAVGAGLTAGSSGVAPTVQTASQASAQAAASVPVAVKRQNLVAWGQQTSFVQTLTDSAVTTLWRQQWELSVYPQIHAQQVAALSSWQQDQQSKAEAGRILTGISQNLLQSSGGPGVPDSGGMDQQAYAAWLQQQAAMQRPSGPPMWGYVAIGGGSILVAMLLVTALRRK